MKKIKHFILFLIVGLFLFTFTSCNNNNKYNAVVYSKLNDKITKSALENNMISGIEDDDTENNPATRLITINNKELYEQYFKDNSIECDFINEILYLYVYRSVYASNDIALKNINYNENKLSIEFKDESGNMFVSNACQPYARWIGIKMNKLEAEEIEFIKK